MSVNFALGILAAFAVLVAVVTAVSEREKRVVEIVESSALEARVAELERTCARWSE